MTRQERAYIRERGPSLQSQGRSLLTALHATAQALKLYPFENTTVQKSIHELHRVAQRITELEGEIELHIVDDFIFLNDARLRLDFGNFAVFSFLANTFARHEIAIVEIGSEIESEEWAPFLSILLDTADEDEPFQRFIEKIEASPVRNIWVAEESTSKDRRTDDSHAREDAKRTYFQTIEVAREVLGDVRLGKAVNVRRVKRAVQSIVDQVINHETAMIGMTTLRDYDEYTFAHSVNVCILSVIIGQRLGLTRIQLYELGVGALFHDIGKMRVDPEITAKEGPLTEEEFEAIKEHPTYGLLTLFSMHGFTDPPYRAMRVAYEHHMRTDLKGYPVNHRPRRQSLFSRIVAVADGFDAGTSERSYQPSATPDVVLESMRGDRGMGYDPIIVKALSNVTGVYPVGTLVILDSYELAVVYERNPDPKALHQPIVKILADPMGLPLAEPELADLSEIDPETGQPRRTIIKTTDPERYDIRIGEYFL